MIQQIFPDAQVYFQLARFLLVLFLGVSITRLALMPLTEKLMKRRKADIVSTHSFSNLAGVTGVFMSFIIALQAAEFGNLVTVLGAITAALTVAVGFGMRDQISNLVAGFLLYFDSPFIKGDYIEVGEKRGIVKEIKLRHTTIKNGSSEKTVVPNSMLTTNPVENYSEGRKSTVSMEFKVENSKATQLEKIIGEATKENKEIQGNPKPSISYRGLKEGKTTLQAEFKANSNDVGKIRKSVNRSVNEKAAKKGLFDSKE